MPKSLINRSVIMYQITALKTKSVRYIRWDKDELHIIGHQSSRGTAYICLFVKVRKGAKIRNRVCLFVNLLVYKHRIRNN